jgi:hypothetical protein
LRRALGLIWIPTKTSTDKMDNKPRVLVADKWKTWGNLFRSLLRDDFSVVLVSDLEEAKLAVREANPPFYVVVVDIQLTDNPNQDLSSGRHSLLDEAQARKAYTKPVLVISYGPDETQVRNVSRRYEIPLRRRVRKLGAKKFDHKRFSETVREAVNAASREAEIYNKEILKMSEYVDFELHIEPNGHARAHSNEGDRVAEISLSIPTNVELTLGLIEARRVNDKLLKEFGKQLYEIIFPAPIHTHFNQTEAVARENEQMTRIRLTIEPDNLASLPWEFMYRDERGYFLGTNPNTVLARYLNLPLPQKRVRRREEPLHLLVIIANPSDQTRLDPDEWENIILQTLDVPIKQGQLTTQVVKRATYKSIRKALLQQEPDVIQFVGHGIYKDGKGYLAMVDDKTGQTWKVDDEQFASMMQGFDSHLGLVSLATCESAKSDSQQSFLGIAPKIVQLGVPAVVAMQYEVLIETAERFLENFYTSVAARKPVDWAVQLARNSIAIEMGFNNREFATPVLYMRAEDGEIF